jgi:hypothetical protein
MIFLSALLFWSAATVGVVVSFVSLVCSQTVAMGGDLGSFVEKLVHLKLLRFLMLAYVESGCL